MANPETTSMLLVGSSGPVSEMVMRITADPRLPIKLGAVATTRDERAGKRLGDLPDVAVPLRYEDIRLINIDDAIHNTDHPVVLSNLRAREAVEYEDDLAMGRLVITNSSGNRKRPDVPLINPFINPARFDEFYRTAMTDRIIAIGNCLTLNMGVPTAPIYREFGIERMTVETSQGWSGKGFYKVPAAYEGQFPKIEDLEEGHEKGDERDKIETELQKFLGTLGEPADFGIVATPKRGPWVRGHHARIVAYLAKSAGGPKAVEELWEAVSAPAELEAVKTQLKPLSAVARRNWPKKHRPIKPVKVSHKELFDAHNMQLARVHPMRVKARVIDLSSEEKENDKLTYEIAGDNLVFGAAGSGLLLAIYAQAKGYL